MYIVDNISTFLLASEFHDLWSWMSKCFLLGARFCDVVFVSYLCYHAIRVFTCSSHTNCPKPNTTMHNHRGSGRMQKNTGGLGFSPMKRNSGSLIQSICPYEWIAQDWYEIDVANAQHIEYLLVQNGFMWCSVWDNLRHIGLKQLLEMPGNHLLHHQLIPRNAGHPLCQLQNCRIQP